ncbi:MAG: hypothetical protein GX640_17585, partial [Fibrobacter sp.]|nr:hypothetical protein [Fibrobacter sp.]
NWQKWTWTNTSDNNRLMIAGHVIEKQVENRRMIIAMDREKNYAAFKSLSDTVIVDNSVSPAVTVEWKITPAYDLNGNEIPNVRTADLTASWGYNKGDTLRVRVSIAKDF